jgi:hypothetical protein
LVVPQLVALAVVSLLLGSYGECGRILRARGRTINGDSGPTITLAWPFFIWAGRFFLCVGAASLLAVAVIALV